MQNQIYSNPSKINNLSSSKLSALAILAAVSIDGIFSALSIAPIVGLLTPDKAASSSCERFLFILSAKQSCYFSYFIILHDNYSILLTKLKPDVKVITKISLII